MTTTATQKLTRAEACAELAQRMGLFYQIDGEDVYAKFGEIVTDRDNVLRLPIWNPFTSRDAAAELVTWIAKDFALYHRFDMAFFDPLPNETDFNLAAFLATPEQITLAACKALGIEVE